MSAYRDARGVWRYRVVVKLPDGSKLRISGTPNVNTKRAAEVAEREHVERTLAEAVVERYAPGSLARADTPDALRVVPRRRHERRRGLPRSLLDRAMSRRG